MHNVYIGIGTNIEPRSERILKAIESLTQFGIIEKRSLIYETAPFGYTDQPNFLNAAILLRTNSELVELHEGLKLLEKKLERIERQRWHEREIDFDILFYDAVTLISKTLTVPHPQLQNRAFVLVPLNEIASDLFHPVFKKNIASLLQELSYEKSSICIFEGE